MFNLLGLDWFMGNYEKGKWCYNPFFVFTNQLTEKAKKAVK
jgi:hypothetical protein